MGIENWDVKFKKAHSVTSTLDVIATDSAKIHLSNMQIDRWSVNLNHAFLQTDDVLSGDLKLIVKNHSWAEITPIVMSVTAMRDYTSFYFIR